MKRASVILTGLIFMTLFGLKTSAQSDDVYYDPNTDKASPNNSQDYSQRNTDRTYNDGYASQSSRQKGSKTYVDSSGNTINNYDDSYYSSQLERFYGPSCGLGYYDYAYTPAYYWGWGGLGYGYGGYYGGSYWGWNTGWGLCGYYNPWYSPFGIYGYGYGFGYGRGFGYGYGAYGYGRGYGYGYGGYYGRGYGEGYGNRYYGATATNRYTSEPQHRDARAESHTSAMENNTAHPNNLGNPTEGKNNNGYKPTGNAPQASGKGTKANQNNGGWKQVEPQGWSNANNNNAARNSGANNGGNRANRNGNVQQAQQGQHSQGQYGNSSQPRGGNYGQSQGNHYSQPQQRSSAPAQSYHGGYSSGGGGYHSSGGGGGSHSSGGGGGSHGGGGGRH